MGATATIVVLEGQLADAQKLLAQKEQERQDALADKKLLEQDNVNIKKEIGDMEITKQKIEQEKTARDHTIKTLNDEIASQDEEINKLTKEKKHISENAAKSAEDLLSAEEKLGHMNHVTKKLEGTFDELEGSL